MGSKILNFKSTQEISDTYRSLKEDSDHF